MELDGQEEIRKDGVVHWVKWMGSGARSLPLTS